MVFKCLMHKCIIPLHLLTETFHISFFGTKLGKSASGVHTMYCPQHFMVFVLHFCILKFNMAGFGNVAKEFQNWYWSGPQGSDQYTEHNEIYYL